jgi:hypothetical protein
MSDRSRFVLNALVAKTAAKMVQNFLTNREAYLQDGLDRPNRDLNKECGYPELQELTPHLFKQWYDREGFATRANDLLPDETWQVLPELYETEDDELTEFEKAWNKLVKSPRLNPWHYLHRVDRLSGIGHYGVLFFGFSDGRDPEEPVAGFNDDGTPAPGRPREKPLKLLYIRAFTSINARVVSVQNDPAQDRYGEPTAYDLTVADVGDATDASGTATPPDFQTEQISSSQTMKPVRVHWQRILHVADNRFESEIYGVPRLQTLINRCFDLRKILGGSAEMFWKGGYPGYSVEAIPEALGLSSEELDKEGIAEEMQLFMNGLQRFVAVDGVTIKSLSPQVADPTAHIFQQLLMMALAIGCPLQILIGSDSKQGFSEEQTKRWHSRLARRQVEYVEPWMVRPLVERFQMVGILPPTPNDYFLSWRDLNSIKETDKADIALKTTQALLQYVSSGAEKVMPLYHFITRVLNWSHELAVTIVKEVSKTGYKTLTKDVWKATQKLPPGTGQASAANQTGQQRNSQGQTSRNNT